MCGYCRNYKESGRLQSHSSSKGKCKAQKECAGCHEKQGYISQKQYDKAMADDVYGRISEHNDVREETMNTYFVDAVIDDVFDDLVNIKGYSESEAYKAIYQGIDDQVHTESSNPENLR